MTRVTRWAILLFFLSGASGLVYETAWTRLYQDLFGHSVHTTAAVLAAFMGGLGLGAVLAGRWAHRVASPLAVYGGIELGLGLWVLSSPLQVAGVDVVVGGMLTAAWAAPWTGELLRWLLAFALLLLPTAAMGATLPLLCQGLIDEERSIGSRFGLLYGVNTLGAVVGVVAAGFWLIRSFGVVATLGFGSALSVTAGVGALVLSRLQEGAPATGAVASPVTERPARQSPELPRVLLLVVFLTGFAALAYEVVWIRLFVFVLGSSILSFSLVLGTLLAAFAAGAVLLPRVVRSRARHLEALAWIQALLAVAAAGTLVAFAKLPELLELVSALGASPDQLAGRAMVSVLVLALPGVLMGAALPAATGAIRSQRTVAAGIGRLYAANTAGNIAGSLVAGYLLLPMIGAAGSLPWLALLNVALSAVILVACVKEVPVRRRVVPAAAAVVVAAAWWAVPPAGVEEVYAHQNPHASLLATTEGLRGTVTVHEVAPLPILAANNQASNDGGVGFGYRLVAVDGVDVAGTAPDLRTTQKAQAHIPLLLHGAPQAVLQVGYGSGETTCEVARYRPAIFHLAEINPDVIVTSDAWFPDFADAPFTPFFADAKNFIRTTSNRYDVILNDSTYPGLAGSSQLYSADHFRACRERLNPGGVVSTWLPVDLPVETFRLVLATFHSVFPECSFWLPANCWNKHGVLLGTVGDMEQLLDRALAREWPVELLPSLEWIGGGDPQLFAAMQVLDPQGVREVADGAPVSSDDHPRLEYPSRGVRVSGEEFWAETLSEIVRHPPAAGSARSRTLSSEHDEAVTQLFAGQLALLAEEPDRALRFYQRAADQWPDHPGPRRLIQDVQTFRAQAAFEAARARAAAGDEAHAVELLAEAAALCPISAAVRYELGRLLFERGRAAQAVPHLRRALELGEDLDRAQLLLGDALLLSGDAPGAEASYRAWLQDHPPTPEVVAAVAEAMLDQGRLDAAVSTMEEAARMAPGHQAIAARLAEIRVTASSP